MNYKNVIKDSLLLVFSGLIVSCFFGAPFLVYFVFDEIFKYIGYDETMSYQLSIIFSIFLLIVVTFVVILRNLMIEVKKYIKKKESQLSEEWDQKSKILSSKEREIEVNRRKMETEYEMQRNKIIELRNESSKIIDEKSQTYPWLAKLYSDFMYIYDDSVARNLKYKSHPAEKAAKQVSEIAKEKRILQKLAKMYEYQLNYYENIFPWLEDFKEVEPTEAWEIIRQTDNDGTDEYDTVKNWLSPDDYKNLPSDIKWQLALDRYCKKRKTNWEIGIDYERYVGHLYEVEGYKVQYAGALLGLEDMGRDVIANNKDEMVVIQCKRWSKEKTIREKHIFQLYGSVVVLRTQYPAKKIIGRFVTTTKLSDLARKCAEYLEIEVIEAFAMKTYPMIKCNKTIQSGMIYHLPFDQQYDRVHINAKDGDVYISTVAEAEKNGFRHAYRWHGTD